MSSLHVKSVLKITCYCKSCFTTKPCAPKRCIDCKTDYGCKTLELCRHCRERRIASRSQCDICDNWTKCQVIKCVHCRKAHTCQMSLLCFDCRPLFVAKRSLSVRFAARLRIREFIIDRVEYKTRNIFNPKQIELPVAVSRVCGCGHGSITDKICLCLNNYLCDKCGKDKLCRSGDKINQSCLDAQHSIYYD